MLKGINIEQLNFTFGNTITYECIPGYLMFGQPNARCLANGKWSRTHSRCSSKYIKVLITVTTVLYNSLLN